MYTSLFRHIWKSQVLKEFFFKKNQKTFFFPAFPLQKGGLFNNYQQVINIHCTSPAGPYYNFTPYLKIVKDEREKNVIFIFHFFYFQYLHFSNVSKQHLLSASFFFNDSLYIPAPGVKENFRKWKHSYPIILAKWHIFTKLWA